MAVLIEAISVVVRVPALDQQFSGGWDAFKTLIPGGTSCVDGQLIRLGFTTRADADSFVAALRQHGLIFLRDGKAVDFVVVDQLSGPTTACDWIEFGTVTIRGATVAACRATGDDTQRLFTPDGWNYEGSLSQTPDYERASADIGMVRQPDVAELLADEAEAWLNSVSGEGAIPRAFFGITGHDQKFLMPLNTNLLDQHSRLEFVRWLCQRVVAYAYVTHVRRHSEDRDPASAQEGVDIYASSMTSDVAVALTIASRSDGSLAFRRDRYSSHAASGEPGMFAGLQRTKVEFGAREEAEFGEIWRQLSATVQWLKT